MALPEQMVEDAKRHKKVQDAERVAAGEMWVDYGLVWCQPNGRPVDAHQDWKDVLREA
jgi:hypothetical protein